MVPEVTRLRFYSTTYSGKDKYKSKNFVKKRSSGYKKRQQEHSTTQKRIMDKKNYSRSNNVEKEQDNRLLWDALDMNNFYFLLLLFSDFIGILFSFSFLLDNEEAHDTAVTWHVTWCDVIGLEGGGRI